MILIADLFLLFKPTQKMSYAYDVPVRLREQNSVDGWESADTWIGSETWE